MLVAVEHKSLNLLVHYKEYECKGRLKTFDFVPGSDAKTKALNLCDYTHQMLHLSNLPSALRVPCRPAFETTRSQAFSRLSRKHRGRESPAPSESESRGSGHAHFASSNLC